MTAFPSLLLGLVPIFPQFSRPARARSQQKDTDMLTTIKLAGETLAQAALLWTREQLSEEQRQWLRDLKLVRQVRDFTIVHATLDSPGSWGYVTNRFDAMASFSYQFTQICFYGDTHVPRMRTRRW